MQNTAISFFEALYKNCSEGYIEFRYLPSGKQVFVPMANLVIPAFPKDQNIFFGVGTRDGKGGTKDNLVEIPALWIDFDFKHGSEKTLLIKLTEFPLKPSAIIHSGGGYHFYWFLKDPATRNDIPQVESTLKRLASFYGTDMAVTDASRILRVPLTLNLKYGPPLPVQIRVLHPSSEYNLSEFDNLLPETPAVQSSPTVKPSSNWPEDLLLGVPEGERNQTAARLAGRYLARGLGEKEILEFLLAWNQKNAPPLTEEEIKAIVESLSNTHKRNHGGSVSSWPSLSEEAFYGLSGEFIRMIEPDTESDPVALLIQILTAVGNIIGNTAYFQVEADKHHLKLFSVLVGESSKGRKGTSWGVVKSIFRQIDPEWSGRRIMTGLSSGEGLIWQVRDEIKRMEPIREKGLITDYQENIIDQGENDKRLFVIEPEFAAPLRTIGREGNTLSPIIRQAWDDGNLRVLTKTSPAKATDAHISIIGHITREELRRYLNRTEMGNGFANRFIWLCVRRSKVLPEGGRRKESNLAPFLERFLKIVEFGKIAGEIKKDPEAARIWAEVYPNLSEGKPGLLGAVTSRAEAQVMRLACIYALLDKSNLINPDHLRAALALWDYSDASARYIFGDAAGDLVANRILGALPDPPAGLTRTEIRDLFARHMNGTKIESVITLLESQGRIEMVRESTAGRPVEKWVLRCDQSDQSNKRAGESTNNGVLSLRSPLNGGPHPNSGAAGHPAENRS